MNLIAPGTVAAFRFAFLELPREEPSNIAALEGAAVVLVPGCGLHAKIAHILIHALLRSRCLLGPFLIAHQQRNYELGLRTPRPQHLEALARALGVDPAALVDYGLETARDALEVLFRLEEGFGARPEAVVTVDAQCTSCADEAMNQKALDVMEGLQIQVINR